ncbi:TauD/TfdA family dioxygenase [Pectobacterium versatile]|uniref:Pyoverdine biosynthesis protein n=1 Tax=Pectobacterium versatile TaxID=2488639 RepID=A0A855MGQ0_9GAMM|nr:TauD/TfdA family dioxygenase [Pectobacterium versatile]POY49875.1 Pyoverdine biosynthesis protein [Pectobacterium versatile]QPK14603.1 TauD/TfdA family dioxygenase [Pectobacterium versatile]
MDSFTLEDRFDYQPLINSQGETCHFGVRIEPKQSGVHIGELSPTWLRTLVENQQLVILRGFDSFTSAENLTTYCEAIGDIMQWPFGAVLELVEQPDATDHIFANNYVPLHWDGMYLKTVPELQVFQCVSAIGEEQGGRTTFSSTTAALRLASPETKALWQRATGQYQRAVELYSSTAQAPIIEQHPYRTHPVIRFCEPPIAGDKAFLNPSTYHFSGIEPEEQEQLLSSLQHALYDPRVQYAHQWQSGDIVIADNYSLLHGRESYASQSGRHLRRVHIHAKQPLTNPHLVQPS